VNSIAPYRNGVTGGKSAPKRFVQKVIDVFAIC
jgi:hypothetical protein